MTNKWRYSPLQTESSNMKVDQLLHDIFNFPWFNREGNTVPGYNHPPVDYCKILGMLRHLVPPAKFDELLFNSPLYAYVAPGVNIGKSLKKRVCFEELDKCYCSFRNKTFVSRNGFCILTVKDILIRPHTSNLLSFLSI